MRTTAIILFICFLMPALVLGQPKWKKSATKKKMPLELFHSTQTANFPTTETLKKGDWEYEISHRFGPTIDAGYDALFGLDGPVKMRTALSYGFSDHFTATLARSNLLDNLDFQLKYRLFQIDNKILPSVFALNGGISWNTDIPESINRDKADGANFQYYLQLIYNTILLDKKLAIGIVPSYLYNSFIFSLEKQYTFTLGNYYQYYFNDMWSLWLEYNPIIMGYQGVIELNQAGKSYNSLAWGIDIETGGHIFHLFLTNNNRLNPSQYIVGADKSVSDGKWRIGFGITRHL